jgi:hypothetical protein
MAGSNEAITLRLVAQDLFSGNVSKAIAGLDKLAQRGGLVGSVLQGVGQSMGQLINPVSLVAGGIGMVTDIMGDSIKAASDQAEALSKVTVVFGDQAREIQDWARTASTSMGMSETAALSAAGTLGNLFDALGLADDATRDMSKGIVQLAADLGSFNNVATEEALTALQAGLVGETEPMRRFGANLSAARVEAHALARGMAATKSAITESMKVQARYELILEDTKNAQGDFARTSDGLANSQKTLDAKVADLSVKVGQFLQGPAQGFVGFLTGIVEVVSGPQGTSAQLRSVAENIRRIHQEAMGGVSAMDASATALQRWADVLNNQLFPNSGNQVDDWLAKLGPEFFSTFGSASNELLADFRAIAQAVNDTGGTWSDFYALVLGKQQELVKGSNVLTNAWTGNLRETVDVAKGAGAGIYDGLVRPVRRAMRDMFRTAADAKAPWKAAMKELAEAGKDPFRDEKFAGWMERRAQRFINQAKREFRQGKGDWRREARALAYVMTNPILVALAKTQEEIQALANAAAVFMDINRSIGGFRRNGGGPGGTNEGGIDLNAHGTSNYRGGWTWVGEQGPELMRLPQGTQIRSNQQSMAMAGGGTINLTVNVAPTADPASIGREITKVLNAYRNAGGAPALKAAVGF